MSRFGNGLISLKVEDIINDNENLFNGVRGITSATKDEIHILLEDFEGWLKSIPLGDDEYHNLLGRLIEKRHADGIQTSSERYFFYKTITQKIMERKKGKSKIGKNIQATIKDITTSKKTSYYNQQSFEKAKEEQRKFFNNSNEQSTLKKEENIPLQVISEENTLIQYSKELDSCLSQRTNSENIHGEFADIERYRHIMNHIGILDTQYLLIKDSLSDGIRTKFEELLKHYKACQGKKAFAIRVYEQTSHYPFYRKINNLVNVVRKHLITKENVA